MKDLSEIINRIVPMPTISYNKNSMKGVKAKIKIPKGYKRRQPKYYKKKRNVIIFNI